MQKAVPIYDAWGKTFLPEDLFENGPKRLPLLKDGDKMIEVPIGSIVVVCHTVYRRVQEGRHLISFNIHWVVVLAIPDDSGKEAGNVESFESDPEMEVEGNYWNPALFWLNLYTSSWYFDHVSVL